MGPYTRKLINLTWKYIHMGSMAPRPIPPNPWVDKEGSVVKGQYQGDHIIVPLPRTARPTPPPPPPPHKTCPHCHKTL